MAHRAAPISVSIALGHASANAVKATAGGWSTSSASLTFPFHSHMSSARREGSEYHFKSLWYDSAGARTHDLPIVRHTLYHWAITPVYCLKYCGHSKYCSIRASRIFGSLAFVDPLKVVLSLLANSLNVTTSSTLNIANDLAIWPARYVLSSGDCAFSRIEPGSL